MICDAILYGLLGIIIGKITHICEPRTLFSRKVKQQQPHADKENDDTQANYDNYQGVQLLNIVKEYKISKNHNLVALDALTINFHENEITGLLGHNGAGKTTTMNILTGMLKPTTGVIFRRLNNVKDNISKICNDIGYCPQNGILYDNISVKEHLTLYANIRKTDQQQMSKHVESLMKKMNLHEKEKVLAKHLSEGLRRCLCVGMAFAGNSPLVVLDEPTSGVDSAARRRI